MQGSQCLVVVRLLPGLLELVPHPGALPFRQVLQHIPLLVNLAALDLGLLAEHLPDRGPERLGPVDHDKDAFICFESPFY